MAVASQAGETRVVLDNVSWATFETLLAETGPRRGRFAYVEGTLEIMSPSAEHEILKSAIGTLVEVYAQVMGIDIAIVGSMTLKRQLKQRGVEPDESYYVQNEARVRGRMDLDIAKDPPPDLAIEIQLVRSALDKLGIYAAMGVPEVWLWEEERLVVRWLADDAAAGPPYVEHEQSRAFPGLPLDVLLRFAAELKSKSITRIANEFRAWVEKNTRRDSAEPTA